MQKLARGIHEFRANYFSKNATLFERLATAGQRPETLFVTCSDSRVVPDLITSAAPGELFIVRNVGNIVPPMDKGVLGGVAAAIQYAVEMLAVENVIVCGHTQCGAIDAIMHPERVAHLGFVAKWLEGARTIPEILSARYGELEGEALMTAAVEENVLVQLENLRTLPAVASRLVKGDLHLHGWVYKIETGEVFAYDLASGQFVPLAEYQYPPSEAEARQRTTGEI